jgi:hypothetical protein
MKNKILFDLVNNIGEGLFISLHIIDITEEADITYRIYHDKGYCFNVEREYMEAKEFYNKEERKEAIDGYFYYFQSDLFEGFETLTIDEAIELISKYKK